MKLLLTDEVLVIMAQTFAEAVREEGWVRASVDLGEDIRAVALSRPVDPEDALPTLNSIIELADAMYSLCRHPEPWEEG